MESRSERHRETFSEGRKRLPVVFDEGTERTKRPERTERPERPPKEGKQQQAKNQQQKNQQQTKSATKKNQGGETPVLLLNQLTRVELTRKHSRSF